MSKRRIILASRSPRRKALLEQVGLDFEVRESEYEEDMQALEDPIELVKFLALKKAEDVAKHYDDAIVIGADTFVVYDNKFIGKPKDAVDAQRILKMLSGQENTIVTGFAVIDTVSGKVVNSCDKATIKIRKLSDEDIDSYIATGEPLDKAGAFGIQGVGAVIVERVDGDYHNIMGLPLSKLYDELKNMGVDILASSARHLKK
ncbi:septum formation inhibitor Maf [Candidatus Falkowbacteria bacterium]|nr:septum formation inhibitor Maf [Candidatus Falkowbacteria bacterium]